MILPRYQTFWRRFWAGTVDGIVFWPFSALSNFIWAHQTLTLQTYLAIWFFIQLALPIVYSTMMHWRYGQTLGKMACGVMVVDVSEKITLTLWQAIKRDIYPVIVSVAGFMLTLPYIMGFATVQTPIVRITNTILGYSGLFWFGLEILTMVGSQKRRALHDVIAGSVVLRRTYFSGKLRKRTP
jgi:uncharacterized RDD family membrane protein YckC